MQCFFCVSLETPSAHSAYPRPEMKPNQAFCCWASLCLSKNRLHDSPDWHKITSCVSPMANHMGHQGLWEPIFWHTIIYPKDTSIPRMCWVHYHGLCDPRTQQCTIIHLKPLRILVVHESPRELPRFQFDNISCKHSYFALTLTR
jgi:hypothetical protein